jgi:antitoxin component of MazEF toxin-antitoxin module
MATNSNDLTGLLDLVTKSLTTRIEADIRDELPTDAATLGVAIKLLKDNNITADPLKRENLKELQAKMAEQAAQRRQRRGNVIALAGTDLPDTGT